MRIDRCQCFGRTFAELRDIAKQTGVDTVEDLQREVEFGLKCGLCKPYVRRMLSTGEIVFRSIIVDAPAPGSSAEGE